LFFSTPRDKILPPKKNSPFERSQHDKQGVGQTVALQFILKNYLKAKEELWKLKYFTMPKYNLQKNPLKETQNPSRYYYNSIITNLKFQHKFKISSFKHLHIKIDLLFIT